LQRLHQGNVLGNIIVLAPDPSGDSNGAVGGAATGAIDYHSNTRRARIPQRTAIDVGYEIRRCRDRTLTLRNLHIDLNSDLNRDLRNVLSQPCVTHFPASRYFFGSLLEAQVARVPVDVPVQKWETINLSFIKRQQFNGLRW
jgi:hypothetical protein